MSAHPQSDESLLKRRARYFFSTDRRARHEVRAFASTIGAMGECAVVGGMLRDLCLGGNRAFRSDVDFVAAVEDLAEFDKAMRGIGASVNRFGGYGVKLDVWHVDVWPLQRTWAAREGHADVTRLQDVLCTTFFDWDAVLYFPSSGEVSARRGYFEGLRNRILDVNLLPNPNPMGNAVRALRYACMWEASFAPRLACHVDRQIAEHGWETLVNTETRSFGTHHLRWFDPENLVRRLKAGHRGANVAVVANASRRHRDGPDDELAGKPSRAVDSKGTKTLLGSRAAQTRSGVRRTWRGCPQTETLL